MNMVAQRISKAFTLSLIVLLMAACSLIDNDDKKEVIAPLIDLPAQAVELDKVWSRSVGSQGDRALGLQLTPAISGGSIYAASASGDVMAIGRADGDIRWETDVDVELISAVGAGGDLVVVSSVDGGVHAIDAATGAVRWRAQASSEVLAPAAIDSNVVVIQAVDSRVQAFEASTGRQLWSYSASQAVLSVRGNSAPVIKDGAVYVAFDNGKLAILDAKTGLLRWERRFMVPDGRSEFERVIDVQSDPVLTDSAVIVGCYQGSVISVARDTGQPQWQEKASVVQNMAVSDDSLFIVEGDSVRALMLGSGREAWKTDGFSGRRLSGAAVLGDYVAIADKEGYVHLLKQSDGSYVGRYSVGGDGVRANLLSDDGALYALTGSGKLFALAVSR
ncbi:MAG TPA: outer membrane protein assembly factor BamB [Pseudomonadales bacterium]|nr:outer membrane protein assembly factor BamB [Pseudomonadales bacterium]